MKHLSKIAAVCLCAAVLVVGVGVGKASSFDVIRAKAHITGAPGSGVSGDVLFVQFRSGIIPTVTVLAKVSGFAPNTVHGFHIHENGLCTNADGTLNFLAAGGHYDPGPNSNSNPDTNHPFHMGDMQNLIAGDDGVAFFEHTTSRVTLTPGPLTVFDANGSAVIVHGNPDQGITGAAGSGVSGGPRIGCGVIELID